MDLGMHPLADSFIVESDIPQEKKYPLVLNRCDSCGHVQAAHLVSREARYTAIDYSYDSANSPVSIAHFGSFANEVLEWSCLKKGDLVVDIGSNVGTLLEAFKSKGGVNILGVEPSPNISRIANERGVPTYNGFFENYASSQASSNKRAMVITITNALNHVENLDQFMDSIGTCLHNDGVLIVEVPSLVDLLRKTAFDTIYHEHIHYFSLQAIGAIASKHKFQIVRFANNEYMGGSIRVYLKKAAAGESKSREDLPFSSGRTITKEEFHAFALRVGVFKSELLEKIASIKDKGGVIAGIGAPAKGNTLLNYCGIDRSSLSFIAETSVLKIGKLTPGTHIPILAEARLQTGVTHGLILPWNIAPFLVKKLSAYNLEFIVPTVRNND